MPLSPERKARYHKEFTQCLEDYDKVLIVEVDNVGSQQIQEVRKELRGLATIVMGKNTLMRKVMQDFLHKKESETHQPHPYEHLIHHIVGNIGLVFCKGDLALVREKILANKKPAPARAGAIAPNDVVIPPGPTGCDPGQTSFFQALNIATKIQKAQIEIISPVELLHIGDKVLPGQAALLEKLNIFPFTYGMVIKQVYDNGSLFDAVVLDLTPDDIKLFFLNAVRNIAAISLEVGYPTLASLPHSLNNAFKMLVAICADETVDYTFEKAEPYLQYLADPSAFATTAPAASSDAVSAPAKVEEEKEEEQANVGGLFGDDEDW